MDGSQKARHMGKWVCFLSLLWYSRLHHTSIPTVAAMPSLLRQRRSQYPNLDTGENYIAHTTSLVYSSDERLG
ncbi:uncharacterized protein EI97DRAFT_436430 [Westerdykella ornata]|uniref:Secreted protein n=1 Tax=Westerdykella ornata TaxID=318751 RepID=A0A6A6J9U4_WESOR|nr:uncharacterized protein EI97DRAFT_436430 [Westerdykella ornata]KAF2272994.1 hypothetical protein EI97DRAFT_436430 [Westerdykella ornata]